MASANVDLGFKGVDKTGAAFTSIRNRARLTGAQIRSMVGGALAAAGAYLSFRAIKGGIDELGNLSDMAMKAGTSVETLTQSALAFQVAGLNLPVETLARSFQYLKKQTGEGGMDNFFKVAQEISKIEDPAKRGAELIKNFGRSGLELQPLIDGGEEAIAKMKTLTEIMPGVSQAAADAGDAASDALKVFGIGAHSLFLKIIGNIVGMWSEDFPGGVRAGALSAVNYLEAFAKKTMAIFTVVGKNIAASVNWWFDLFGNGYEFANSQFAKYTDEASNEFVNRMTAIDNQRAAYVSKLKELNVDDLAGALGGGRGGAGTEAAAKAAVEHAVRVSNQLISGGSNAERRLQILGPTYQNEQKKQTGLLEKIAANTKKSADNSDGDLYQETNLGV